MWRFGSVVLSVVVTTTVCCRFARVICDLSLFIYFVVCLLRLDFIFA